MSEDLKARQNEIETLRQTLDDREVQTKDMSSKYAQLSKLEQKKARALKRELDERELLLKTMNSEVETAKEEIEFLKKREQGLGTDLQHLKVSEAENMAEREAREIELRSKNQKMKQAIHDRDESHKRLINDNEEQTRMIKDLSEKVGTINEAYSSEVTSLQEEKDMLKEELVEKQADLENLH